MNKEKEYDLIFYIGRTRPFHNAHKEIIDYALTKAEEVLVLVGSADSPRTPKNPFTDVEVANTILSTYTDYINQPVFVEYLKDFADNPSWINEVGRLVRNFIKTRNMFYVTNRELKIGYIGHRKDNSSFYLDFFPQWDFIDAPKITINKYLISDITTNQNRYIILEANQKYGSNTLDASFVRELYFNENNADTFILKHLVPKSTYDFLIRFRQTEEYSLLKKEINEIKKYKKLWENVPYPVQFNTVDAVVVQSGHILLIQRKTFPGKGLYALPGGFLNSKETIEESMLRELLEETKIKVPKKVLKGSIVHKQVFDEPNRSLRERTITHAHLIKLDDSVELPKVKGSDDAEKAFWYPLSDFENLRSKLFEDHYFIVSSLLKYL